MQPGGSNDTYRGSSVNGVSHFPTDPLGTGAPPPWRSREFAPVNSLSKFEGGCPAHPHSP